MDNRTYNALTNKLKRFVATPVIKSAFKMSQDKLSDWYTINFHAPIGDGRVASFAKIYVRNAKCVYADVSINKAFKTNVPQPEFAPKRLRNYILNGLERQGIIVDLNIKAYNHYSVGSDLSKNSEFAMLFSSQSHQKKHKETYKA